MLIALTEILYGNKQYKPGEELPTSDASYVDAWKRSGSAAEMSGDGADEDAGEDKAAAKARPAAAPAGVEGITQPATGSEPDLVGKIPSPKARGVVKEPSKRAPKSKT